MIIAKRERHHVRQSPAGTVLVGEAGPHGPVFPPADFYFGIPPDEALIGPTGRLYTFTAVHSPKAPPYLLGMVDFPGNVRVFGRIVDGSSPVRIGARVTVVPFQLDGGDDDYAFEIEEDTQ